MDALKWGRSIFLCFFFFFFFFQLLDMVVALGEDYEILLRIKSSQLDDPTGGLQNWVPNSEKNPCGWSGVACDSPNNSVVSIDLSSFNVAGEFPFDFCRISTLQNLSLANNYINGSLLSHSLALCSNLGLLNLTSNLLVGGLPDFSTGFSKLLILDLSSNNFTGGIPASFGRFPELRSLVLSQNLLNGSIPSTLCNLTKLTRLELAYNPSMVGPLPSDIGNLTKLESLYLKSTNLVGPIPDSIGNLGLLKNLDLSENSLSGEIPYSIGGLQNVVQVELFDNQISGELPASLGNLSKLLRIDLSQNNLTGKLSTNLAELLVESLNLNDNFLFGEIPFGLAFNPKLVQLKLFNNSFSGRLPEYLGRSSELEDFDVSTNSFSGPLPEYLCYKKKLQRLVTFSNGFSGSLPESYGGCSSLNYVRIENNQLSGEIPASFWSFHGLQHLQLENNRFEGPLSPSISGARELAAFLISGNNFSGELPPEICQLGKLARFDVSRNRFSGELPSCITELKKLQTLDMQDNMFSGEIPKAVVSWQELAELNLSKNRLTGEIPAQLGDLPSLTYLDLSENLLSGEIPWELTKLKLNQFNLTGNRLSGRVPSGFDNELYLPSLMGNPNLCSPDLNPLPLCPKSKPASFYVVIVLAGLAFLLLGSLMWTLKSKWRIFAGRPKSSWKVTVFQRVGFSAEDIIPDLTPENLVGEGGSGRVYKVKLKTGQTVAVKRLWGGNKEAENDPVFKSELETLGRIRHGNIVKLLLGCSSVDGNRILVFEYMENGSLGDALHGEKGGGFLDWPTRSSIAIGAAQGLAYLHHDCDPPIVHRDVKSNNILLDEEFVPRVADFGLAKTSQRKLGGGDGSMSRVAGSYGYIAPEYGYTMKVNEKSDVYSFGVLLMELVTGKRPNDAFFGESKDMVKWVTEAASLSSSASSSASFSEEEEDGCHGRNLDQIIDPKLEQSRCNYEEIEKVINIALLCTSALPMNRPAMRKVVEMLKDRKRNLVPTDQPDIKI